VPTRLSSISCPASCSRLARPPKRSPPPPVAARTYRFKGLPSLLPEVFMAVDSFGNVPITHHLISLATILSEMRPDSIQFSNNPPQGTSRPPSEIVFHASDCIRRCICGGSGRFLLLYYRRRSSVMFVP
jgi:hypothetical protein